MDGGLNHTTNEWPEFGHFPAQNAPLLSGARGLVRREMKARR
jgi:hypothetical protein